MSLVILPTFCIASLVNHFWKPLQNSLFWDKANLGLCAPSSFPKPGKQKREQEEKLNAHSRASLVAQWLRIHLPMEGTRVRTLVLEDPTCRGATKPVHHNYWACAIEPACHNYWTREPQLLKPARLEPMLRNKRSHHNEKPSHRNKE